MDWSSAADLNAVVNATIDNAFESSIDDVVQDPALALRVAAAPVEVEAREVVDPPEDFETRDKWLLAISDT
ncbi:hypothetical protein TSTA_102610 [Talaromyces stipitatus ATCC 10500]|uniref:Uncharacterized protein n=1 Tax=Talaromyces stipitatus (strain ATCC 10500 / CBS 375.48 / QM 6759 / NRRL 1006) TaxID=441959 RepID=B8MNE1_TALSN|nr:uncharacterized protein TSTA_102610 [Talaromyces stipitatus ATCC 10500]EED14030.1 hypothetical protein TSTA_102610 [Talaromyces stipitatus ATCC 10500]